MIAERHDDPNGFCNPFRKNANIPYVVRTFCDGCGRSMFMDLSHPDEKILNLKLGNMNFVFHCEYCGRDKIEIGEVSVVITSEHTPKYKGD